MTNIQPLEVGYILRKAREQSVKAVDDFRQKWTQGTGGNKYGEPMFCGFAWVSVHGVKGSTKLGKALKEHGFKKGYPSGLQMWNPANYNGQSMEVKGAGAKQYAQVLKDFGFNATYDTRAD